ncbi:iron complex transport system permease protein [Breoghania corrubedonensis]|uniref:Iron complex transport system permease protein n=1 Tax=Breoghania corrubedonensis TaxID=665038 RepID=A0A2T5UYI0_9HYPH|nr:iron ABC transporter permease [Breoghania corrubedonensis]PTW56557.1 iron complex transport system permease protein [Breoghania corrubedonensis]
MTLTRATDGKPVLLFSSGLQIRIGNLAAAGFLGLLALALTAMALQIGATHTGLFDLLAGLSGGALDPDQAFALLGVRLPRIVIGFMAGWMVAMAGAMLQSLARNPLADPGLFGLSQGSMVVIMLLLVFVPEAPRGLIPVAALAGGLAVALALIWLAGGARSSGLAILLMGIAVDTVLSSVTSILILYTPKETSYSLSDWLAGSLFQASPTAILAIGPWFVLSLVIAFLTGRALKSYDMGDELAQALGEPVARSRPLILLAAVLLSSAAVTAVGPLIFLGVMAPHLAGFVSPARGRARLILSGLAGGVLVVGADCLTRALAGDIALPLGLSLTILGVPLFVITLRLRALRVR